MELDNFYLIFGGYEIRRIVILKGSISNWIKDCRYIF